MSASTILQRAELARGVAPGERSRRRILPDLDRRRPPFRSSAAPSARPRARADNAGESAVDSLISAACRRVCAWSGAASPWRRRWQHASHESQPRASAADEHPARVYAARGGGSTPCAVRCARVACDSPRFHSIYKCESFVLCFAYPNRRAASRCSLPPPTRLLRPSFPVVFVGILVARIGRLRWRKRQWQRSGTARAERRSGTGREDIQRPSLSASGQMSCATCHAAATAHATNDPDLVVPAGGALLDIAGFRNAPSLRLPEPHARVPLRQGRHADRRLQPRRPREFADRAGAAAVPRRTRNGERHARPPSSTSSARRPMPTNSAASSAPASSTRRTRRSTASASRSRNTRKRTPTSIASTASTTSSSPGARR